MALCLIDNIGNAFLETIVTYSADDLVLRMVEFGNAQKLKKRI